MKSPLSKYTLRIQDPEILKQYRIENHPKIFRTGIALLLIRLIIHFATFLMFIDFPMPTKFKVTYWGMRGVVLVV